MSLYLRFWSYFDEDSVVGSQSQGLRSILASGCFSAAYADSVSIIFNSNVNVTIEHLCELLLAVNIYQFIRLSINLYNSGIALGPGPSTKSVVGRPTPKLCLGS